MTGPLDRRPPAPAPGPDEDLEVASLVRDIAATWTLPPRRIDTTTWRDRTTAGRGDGRWRPRLAAAVATALAATVVVALAGAWLGGSGRAPSAGPGSSPPTTGPASPGASDATASPRPTAPAATGVPSATPLPVYATTGAPPVGLTALVQVGGAYRVVDMATGLLSGPLAVIDGAGSRVFALSDGTFLCACAAFGPGTDGTRLDLVLRRFDALGRPTGDAGGLTYKATGGSSAGGYVLAIDPSLSADERRVAVGWTARDGDRWRSGVDMLDATSGSVGDRIALPDLPTTLDATVTLPDRWGAYAGSGRDLYPWAPSVASAPDGGHVAVRRSIVGAEQLLRTDWWTAPVDRGLVGSLTVQAGPGSLAAGTCASGDTPFARWTTPAVLVVLCTDGQTALLRRVDASGAPLGDVDLSGAVDPGSSYIAAGTIVQAPGTETLYVWDAFGRRISAVDTVAGRVDRTTTVEGIGASSGGPPSVLGILGAIGRDVGHLLVPSVVAKVYLDPALAIAPDGSRLYLLATAATGFTDAGRGSLGIVVLDPGLAVVGRWAPTADLVSVAASVDGAWVLAAGSPGVDASGSEAPWEASMTAYDAASGETRAVAGGLGPEVVTLVPAVPR